MLIFIIYFSSAFLTISLCRAGHYFSHPVFSILCHVFRISSCLPLCCPSISFSVGLCSFSQKLLVLVISHRGGCVLTSSSGHTTLVFCFPGKFQQVYMSLLISDVVQWLQSNLVFPPAHLNILIAAEFSLRSSFVLRPNIQDRMSLLVWWLFWRLCFNIYITKHVSWQSVSHKNGKHKFTIGKFRNQSLQNFDQ